jgi:transposase
LFGLPVDPNRADLATLETLPGIGPVRARAIAVERCRKPFGRLADLRRVRGLGPARVRALEPHLAIREDLAAGGGPSVKSGGCEPCCDLGPQPAARPPQQGVD